MADATINKLSDKELKFSYWYITHKIGLRRWLAGVLVIVSLGLWFYVGWQMVFYAIAYPTEVYSIAQIASGKNPYVAILDSKRPVNIDFSSLQPVSLGDTRNDFFGEIYNPNAHWLGLFTYTFKTDTDNQSKQDFILPGERKYIMGLGLSSNDPQVTITNVTWKKISNYESLKNNRFRIEISNEELKPGQKAGDPNNVEFDIFNNSAFGYWNVGVQAFLYSGGSIAGVNYMTINQLQAGEKRHVIMNWNTRLPRIDSIEINPDINFLDENNIMAPIQ